eukprot:3088553-Amphidinium_carterae.1
MLSSTKQHQPFQPRGRKGLLSAPRAKPSLPHIRSVFISCVIPGLVLSPMPVQPGFRVRPAR